jgi:hypothetical protein
MSELASDRAEERDFLALYRAPGIRYLAYASALGAVAAFIYFVMDALHNSRHWSDGPQSLRLVLIVTSLATALICVQPTRFAMKHYQILS